MSQLAVQLYTLRDFTKTPADIARTLARVRQIGYEAVQLSALGPIDAAELQNILKGEGLTCCATHASLDRMRSEPQKVLDEHRLWGCDLTAIGGFWPKDTGIAPWKAFAVEFSAIAAALARGGLRLGYHNHSHELARHDGQTPLQVLVDGCGRDVWFEVDTYWIAQGGGDPCQWIGKVAGRIPAVHLKDIGITPERQVFMAECGEGNLNWPGILAACRAAGVKWFIVEQDICQRDPFDSLAMSLRNLKAMGLA